MKHLVLLAALMCSTSVFADHYTCVVEKVRQNGSDDVLGKGQLQIEEFDLQGLRTITANGKLAFDYTYNVEHVGEEWCYQGVFEDLHLQENEDYKPRIYKNYSKFDGFEATHTARCDGGLMYGYLVIENSAKKQFKAHYVFQAGDHMGGTADLVCSRR